MPNPWIARHPYVYFNLLSGAKDMPDAWITRHLHLYFNLLSEAKDTSIILCNRVPYNTTSLRSARSYRSSRTRLILLSFKSARAGNLTQVYRADGIIQTP